MQSQDRQTGQKVIDCEKCSEFGVSNPGVKYAGKHLCWHHINRLYQLKLPLEESDHEM